MRVITFQPRFHPLILSGVKTSTIRKTARCKQDDKLSLRAWTGVPYRTKQKELRQAVCTKVQSLQIFGAGLQLKFFIDGWEQDEGSSLPKTEGFKDWTDMREWFAANHTITASQAFRGVLIKWHACSEAPAISAH